MKRQAISGQSVPTNPPQNYYRNGAYPKGLLNQLMKLPFFASYGTLLSPSVFPHSVWIEPGPTVTWCCDLPNPTDELNSRWDTFDSPRFARRVDHFLGDFKRYSKRLKALGSFPAGRTYGQVLNPGGDGVRSNGYECPNGSASAILRALATERRGIKKTLPQSGYRPSGGGGRSGVLMAALYLTSKPPAELQMARKRN